MAKNQNTNKNSKTTVCEKLKRAFNISPFRKTHRISHHRSQSINNNTSANNPPLQSQLIPIEAGQEEKYDNAKPHVSSSSSMNRKVVKISSTGHKPMPKMAKHGGNTMPKAEPGKPFTAVQEWQLKPKMEGASKEKTTHDHGDASGHGNDKFSAYITGVRNRMRTSSDLGIERTATMVTKRDSFNDKVTGFLNRAKMNRRTTSHVGDK